MSTVAARLICAEPAARRLADSLGESLDADEAVCAAFEGDDGRWQVAIHFRNPPDEAAVRGLMRLAGGDEAARALAFETVEDADWVAQSLAGLKPVRAGRFVVHGAHDRAHVPVNAVGIEIEAALAFGTGHHGTTRGCLLALDMIAKKIKTFSIPPLSGEGRHAQRGEVGSIPAGNIPHPARCARHPPPCGGRDRKKPRVLDLGTGSGVLAIAAAKAFRTPALASDIDPVAVATARSNARLNRAAAFVTFVCAAGTRNPVIAGRAPYDLIFANILLGPLMRLARPVRALAAPGAHVVLSGLLPSHANAALAIYRAQGFVLAKRIPVDGWMTLVLVRRKPNRPGWGTGAARR